MKIKNIKEYGISSIEFLSKICFVPSLIEIDQVIYQMPTNYNVCIFAIISPWKRSQVCSLIKSEYPSPKDDLVLEMIIFNVFNVLLLYIHLEKGNDLNFQLKTPGIVCSIYNNYSTLNFQVFILSSSVGIQDIICLHCPFLGVKGDQINGAHLQMRPKKPKSHVTAGVTQ